MRTSHLYLIPLLITANLNASHKESSLLLKDHYCSKERIEVGSPTCLGLNDGVKLWISFKFTQNYDLVLRFKSEANFYTFS